METSQTFKQLLINSLPNSFLRQLISGIEHIYPESYSALSNNPSLDKEQAKYVLGYYRRGLAETIVKRASLENSVVVEEVVPENGGCKHNQIIVGNMKLSVCHVLAAGAFPKHSDTREHSSQANIYAAQAELFPIPQSRDKDTLYGIIVHTEKRGSKGELGHIHVGLPDPKFEKWICEPVELRDVLHIQERALRATVDPHAEIQSADPIWKNSAGSNIDKGRTG